MNAWHLWHHGIRTEGIRSNSGHGIHHDNFLQHCLAQITQHLSNQLCHNQVHFLNSCFITIVYDPVSPQLLLLGELV